MEDKEKCEEKDLKYVEKGEEKDGSERWGEM